jgi:hypothetical protein
MIAPIRRQRQDRDNQRPRSRSYRGPQSRSERRADGDGHADHAVLVALPAGFRAGEPAKGEDEEDAGGKIEQRRPGRVEGVHELVPLFLVHGEHALGDEEATKNVHAGKCYGDRAKDLGDPVV